MKKVITFIILFLLAIFGVRVLSYAVSDTVKVQLRKNTFRIPKHIAMDGLKIMPDWLLNMSGLDDGSSTTIFRFDDKIVKTNLPSYIVSEENQFKDDIEGLIIALTDVEVANYKNPATYAQLGDLWNATGSYKKRVIEPDSIDGWYRVYRKVEHPNSWMLLSRNPDVDKSMPDQVKDFWIASCLMQGPTGKRNGRCRTYELIEDVVVEFSVSDYNLPLLDEIRTFIRSQVIEWKQ